MDKFYVYDENNEPVGLIDNADTMTIDRIVKLYRILHEIGHYMVLKPIKRDDFIFDPITGQKLQAKITKFEYPEFQG